MYIRDSVVNPHFWSSSSIKQPLCFLIASVKYFMHWGSIKLLLPRDKCCKVWLLLRPLARNMTALFERPQWFIYKVMSDLFYFKNWVSESKFSWYRLISLSETRSVVSVVDDFNFNNSFEKPSDSMLLAVRSRCLRRGDYSAPSDLESSDMPRRPIFVLAKLRLIIVAITCLKWKAPSLPRSLWDKSSTYRSTWDIMPRAHKPSPVIQVDYKYSSEITDSYDLMIPSIMPMNPSS